MPTRALAAPAMPAPLRAWTMLRSRRTHRAALRANARKMEIIGDIPHMVCHVTPALCAMHARVRRGASRPGDAGICG